MLEIFFHFLELSLSYSLKYFFVSEIVDFLIFKVTGSKAILKKAAPPTTEERLAAQRNLGAKQQAKPTQLFMNFMNRSSGQEDQTPAQFMQQWMNQVPQVSICQLSYKKNSKLVSKNFFYKKFPKSKRRNKLTLL